MSWLIYAAIPAFLVTIAIEVLWARRAGPGIRGYEARDTWTSLTLGVGNVILSSITKIGIVALWSALYERRWLDLPVTPATWLALFVAEDLCYYAFHRAHHEIRALWAAHVNHHSSTRYNLSTALRQSWTTPITGVPFWLVLPLIGFPPAMILTQQAVSLLYQYWLHTEAIGRMPGWFEAVFNTPSHHRVHHGRNARYLDRNHAGILIVWDRLFGTYEPEVERPDYGLTTNLTTHHPVRVAFHEWAAMFRDLRTARSAREVIGFAFGPPGWRPDGSGETAAALRQSAVRRDVSS